MDRINKDSDSDSDSVNPMKVNHFGVTISTNMNVEE